MRTSILGLVLLTASFFPFSTALAADQVCPAARNLASVEGVSVYTVSERARTLYMISRDLYGTEKNWSQIAAWNGLKAPYALSVGQKLVIKDSSVIAEKEADKVLVKSWLALDDMPMVHKISGNAIGDCGPSVGRQIAQAAEAATPAAAPPETVIVQDTKVGETTADAAPGVEGLKPEKDLTPPLESAVPAKVETAINTEEYVEPPEAGLKLGLISSIFKLENKTSEVSNTLYSKANFGAEAALGFQTTDRLRIWLGASLEHIEMESGEGGEISGSSQDFLGLHLTGRYKTGLFSFLTVVLRSIERPFSRPTFTGTNIDKAFVPELQVGGEWNISETARSFTWITVDGIYSHDADSGQQDVKQGYGVVAGLRFDFEFEKNILSLAPQYRYLKQDTNVADNKMEAAVLSLSSTW